MATATAPALAPTSNRIVGTNLRSLDGLRAIAVISVFFAHTAFCFPAVGPTTRFIQQVLHQGWLGVDLFFVLSGFLITSILMDTREAKNYFTGFYARRVLRIFPLYYSVLIGTLVLVGLMVHFNAPGAAKLSYNVPLPSDRWTYFLFLTNWIGLWKAQWNMAFSSMLAHFWSLGIEEQFYLVWPLVVWLVRPRAVPWIAGTVAIASAGLRAAWALHVGIVPFVPPVAVEVQIATICRLDALFLGAIAAYLYRDPILLQRVRRWLPLTAIVGIGVCAQVFVMAEAYPESTLMNLYGPTLMVTRSLDDVFRTFYVLGGFTLIATGFAALILLAAATESAPTRLQRLLQNTPLSRVGKYSYGIYVFHVPVIAAVSAYIPRHLMVQNTTRALLIRGICGIGFAVASYGIAAASYRWFEGPLLRLKRYFPPRYS